MNRRYFTLLAFLAALSLLLIVHAFWPKEEIAHTQPVLSHPLPSFSPYIYGSGLVEAASETFLIAAPVNRLIDAVAVVAGDRVSAGDLLVQLENHDQRALLSSREIALKSALARLHRLEALPRSQELASAKASVHLAQLEEEHAKTQYERAFNLKDPRALSEQETERRRFGYALAQSKREQAQLELEKIQAGSWEPDLEIARLEVAQARAGVEQALVELQRLSIRAPIDGTVLQVNVHPGEMSLNGPLLLLGNVDELNLRVTIDQFDITSFQQEATAVAFMQRGSFQEFSLEFIRCAPLLAPKRNMGSTINEKVDTRVLSLLYRFSEKPSQLLVGQPMDVYIQITERVQGK